MLASPEFGGQEISPNAFLAVGIIQIGAACVFYFIRRKVMMNLAFLAKLYI
jgi:hypothetical protein